MGLIDGALRDAQHAAGDALPATQSHASIINDAQADW